MQECSGSRGIFVIVWRAREKNVDMRFRICICIFRWISALFFAVSLKNKWKCDCVFGSLNFRCIAISFVCTWVVFRWDCFFCAISVASSMLFLLFSTSFSPFRSGLFFGGGVAVVHDIDVCLVSACLFYSHSVFVFFSGGWSAFFWSLSFRQ